MCVCLCVCVFTPVQADNDTTPIHLSMLGVHMLLNGYSYFIPQLHQLKGVKPLVCVCVCVCVCV